MEIRGSFEELSSLLSPCGFRKPIHLGRHGSRHLFPLSHLLGHLLFLHVKKTRLFILESRDYFSILTKCLFTFKMLLNARQLLKYFIHMCINCLLHSQFITIVPILNFIIYYLDVVSFSQRWALNLLCSRG